MYIIFLRFSENKARAKHFMAAHREWISKGMADGVFLLVGSLKDGQGGAIFARGEARTALDVRVSGDPFVQEGIVFAEVHEIEPGKVDPRLQFLTQDDE